MYTDNDVYRIAVAEEPEFLFESMDFLENEVGVSEEPETTEETGFVDYTALLEEIIDKQDAIILVQMDTINALNVNQKKQEAQDAMNIYGKIKNGEDISIDDFTSMSEMDIDLSEYSPVISG